MGSHQWLSCFQKRKLPSRIAWLPSRIGGHRMSIQRTNGYSPVADPANGLEKQEEVVHSLHYFLAPCAILPQCHARFHFGGLQGQGWGEGSNNTLRGKTPCRFSPPTIGALLLGLCTPPCMYNGRSMTAFLFPCP